MTPRWYPGIIPDIYIHVYNNTNIALFTKDDSCSVKIKRVMMRVYTPCYYACHTIYIVRKLDLIRARAVYTVI